MAELKKIEEMAHAIDYREPAWIRGYEKRENHLSGALREAIGDVWGDRTGKASDVLTPAELTLTSLLEEAAETLDDAHQEWLETDIRSRIRRYVVIGRMPFEDNTIVIYDDAEDGGHAERKFAEALDEQKDEDAEEHEPGYYIDFLLEIDGDGTVFKCQDDWGHHGNTKEEAK